MKKIIVLGASGSIGKNTIDIIRKFPNDFTLAGFSVNTSIEFAKLLKNEFPKSKVFISSKQSIKLELEDFILCCNADIVVNGISGAVGLWASIATIKAKLDLALANKESIVMAGYLLKSFANKNNVNIIPVDSEHSAIFSLKDAFKNKNITKIIITASGGPFRNTSRENLKNVTAKEATNHPTWKMGGKISIDSATLANKALEVIEAVKLFDFSYENIIVTVHPESIVHSMIQLNSGEIYAQCSPPDMRFPILQSLRFPSNAPPYLKPLDFTKNFSLHFEVPRYSDFPLLKAGFEVAKLQGAYEIAFNASNEIAVQKFLQGKIKFLEIEKIVLAVLDKDWKKNIENFEDVFEYDKQARIFAENTKI